MLYLAYIIRNWYPAEPWAAGPLLPLLEPGYFEISAPDFEDIVGRPASAFADESGSLMIPERVARQVASYLESFPSPGDILFATCSTFQMDAITALCNAWAELRASGTERMA